MKKTYSRMPLLSKILASLFSAGMNKTYSNGLNSCLLVTAIKTQNHH